jgi:hypothetical protein
MKRNAPAATAAPASAKRAKAARRPAPAWVGKQALALAAMRKGDILMKHGTFKFAAYNRDTYLDEWTTAPDEPIYEVILPDQPTRLYLDVESVAPAEPPAEEAQAWLGKIVEIVLAALLASGVPSCDAEPCLVANDSRPSDGGWKRSFHLTWPNVVFENNHTAMKGWVAENVMPKVRNDPTLQWIAQYVRGPTVKYAVDDAVYSRYRAWRVTYANKKGKTRLTPWDVENWREIPLDEDDRREFIENTLCSQADAADVSLVKFAAAPASSSTDHEDEKEREEKVPAAPRPAGSDRERVFVQAALPMLSPQRRVAYEDWMRTGFAVATVFGKDQIGRDLFRVWSQGAPNYSESACDKVYQGGDAKIGVGSIVSWLKEDAPPAVACALVQTLRDDDPDEEAEADGADGEQKKTPSKLDENKIHQWVHAHNAKVQGLASHSDNQGKEKKELKAMAQALKDELLGRIVRYMNRWLCIIRRQTGRPNVIEEYSRLQKRIGGEGHEVVTIFTLRSPSDALAAYKKHSVHIEGMKQTTPMEMWLNHRASREFDAVDFIPSVDPALAGNGVYNLFRGLAITPALAAACDEDVAPLIDHIKEVWCKGDERTADFLLDWFGHLIQRPGVKMATAPVLKGGQGAGKGIIIQKIGDILGAEHFLGVRNVDSVTGNFQEEKIKTNLLTFLDECTFAGDKRQSSVLKGLITETRRKWEAKFVNPVRIANHSNYIVASNYDQIVFVEEDDRRWVCIEVDSKFAGPQTPESKAYFDTLAAVSAAAFAKHLYGRDLSSFNPRAPPSTEYQRHQKTINFGSVTAFVEHALRQGAFTGPFDSASTMMGASLADIDGADDDGGDDGASFTRKVLKSDVYNSYLGFCTDRGIRRTAIDKAFWRKLRSLASGVTEHRLSRQLGHKRVVVFPALKEARKQFLAAIHEGAWDWDEMSDADIAR